MVYKKKKKGATLAYVIVVLAIVATVGTAIVSLSLSNYKSTIVESKKIENLYMSESGLNEVQALLDNITAEAVKVGNEKVASEMKNTTTMNDIEKEQNKIFKSAYEEYVDSELNKLFNIESDGVFFDTSKIATHVNGTYDIKLLEVNNTSKIKNIYNQSDLNKVLEFKTIDNKNSLSLRMNSKFNVKKGDGTVNYKDVSLTFIIDVPDYNGAYYVETIPMYNVWSQGIVVGKDLTIQNNSKVNVDGGLIAAANLSSKQVNNPNGSNSDIKGVIVSGGNLSVTNGNLISKENIILNRSNSGLKVGDAINDLYGVYTGNLGIYSIDLKNKGHVFSNDVINNNKIISNYPVYTMNDLILNGTSSRINLNSGFYGINSNTRENKFTNQKENSSSIIVNSKDIGDGSSINIKDKALIMGSAYINTKGEAYQTGESVAVKGNYVAYTYNDGKGVTFKYYNPLQLVDKLNGKKMTVEDKAAYFRDNYAKVDGVRTGGITLPDDTTSIGVVISNDNVEFNDSYSLSKQKDVIDRIDKFNKAIDIVEPLESIIKIKNNVNEFKNNNQDLIYLNKEKGSNSTRNRLDITIGNNNWINSNNSNITFKNGVGQGIIITDRDIWIDDNIQFKGTIITTGSIHMGDGKTLDVTYDSEYLRGLIGNNYSDFKDIFAGKPNSNYRIVKTDNSLNSTRASLVKRNNWEVN